jgi:hypothetical protein
MFAHKRDTGLSLRNVRFGSEADIPQCPSNVRFTPEADIRRRELDVCFVPIADIVRPIRSPRQRGQVLPAEL